MEMPVFNDDASQQGAPQKRSKLSLVLGLFLFVALGAGGFFARYSGVILWPAFAAKAVESDLGLSDVAFVPLEQLTLSLGQASDNRHLQFTAQLEVNANRAEEVAALSPRILDVINGYLRAVDTAELTEPDALVRLRAQVLRRIQMVTGQGSVRDLLVTEFVID
jgi:flagellar FliL protein